MPQILVSTVNGRYDFLEIAQQSVDTLVINQMIEAAPADFCSYQKDGKRRGVEVVNCLERGLSKSRNRAIELATSDICVFADDDVAHLSDISETLTGAFDGAPDADVITFQAVDEVGQLRKPYSSQPFEHNWRSITSVGSIEIAFRRRAVIKSGVRFDERFGLGAAFVSGEENIFLMDCIKAGLKVVFIPKAIVVHEASAASGARFENEALAVSKGAVLRRMYGPVRSVPLLVAFALKKGLNREANSARLLLQMINGWRAFGRMQTQEPQ